MLSLFLFKVDTFDTEFDMRIINGRYSRPDIIILTRLWCVPKLEVSPIPVAVT